MFSDLCPCFQVGASLSSGIADFLQHKQENPKSAPSILEIGPLENLGMEGAEIAKALEGRIWGGGRGVGVQNGAGRLLPRPWPPAAYPVRNSGGKGDTLLTKCSLELCGIPSM